jgi:hypothetical protein
MSVWSEREVENKITDILRETLTEKRITLGVPT